MRRLQRVAGRAESNRVPLGCRGYLKEWRVTEISLGPWVWLLAITHSQHIPHIWRVRMEKIQKHGLVVHLKKLEPDTNHSPEPLTVGPEGTLQVEIVTVLAETDEY